MITLELLPIIILVAGSFVISVIALEGCRE